MGEPTISARARHPSAFAKTRPMRTYLLLLLAALAVGFVACEKDTTVTTTTTTNTIAGALEPATISAFGVLTDETGAPVENAVVRAGSESTTTNADGLWRIDGADVAATFGYFTFESPGHLRGSRTVYAQDGSTYELDVQLLSRSQSYAVSAADGGTVRIGDSDAEVVFGAGAFARADGTPVASGEVTVIAHFLDAGEDATYVQMPGDLRGRQTDAASATDLTLLTSYGMVAVEIEDASGDEVELADGQTATLRMPVPLGAEATAPATIPLWYFDEAEGVWVEEGSAVLEGGFYVGEVSHFTFWNCDIPTEYVTLCGTVEIAIDSAGVGTSSTTSLVVEIRSSQWGTTQGYTDSEGRLCGIISANETLILSVLDECSRPLYEQTIGPFAEDVDLGLITVRPDQQPLFRLTGTAVCDNTPLTEGVARAFQNNLLIATTLLRADGTFELEILTCDTTEVSVIVVDYMGGTQSDLVPFTIADTVIMATVATCSTLPEVFGLLKIDGVEHHRDSMFFQIFPLHGAAQFRSGNTSDINIILTTRDTSFYRDSRSPGQYILDDRTSPLEIRKAYGRSIATTIPSAVFDQATFDLKGVSLSITEFGTEHGDFTSGVLGPWQATTIDSNGVQGQYTLELEFSAFTRDF